MPQTIGILEELNGLKDQELSSVIAHSKELLDQRDRQRKKDALEQAKKLLSSVGLSLDGKPVKAKKVRTKKEAKEA